MASLEYLQKQLQRDYYACTLTDDDRAQFYLTNDDLIDEKPAGHSEHRLLFDKVLSAYHKPNVSAS